MLNLIPETFRRRALIRKAACRWGVVCAAVGVVGLALCAPAWWNVRMLREEVARAETDCGEVRQLVAAGDRLNQQLLEATKRQQRYSFSEESHIPLSVVGLLSREAQSLTGRLRIDDFEYRESADSPADNKAQKQRRIVVSFFGFARDDSAISALIVALRSTNYFANVELKSTGSTNSAATDGRRFQIICVLFMKSKLA